MSCLCGDCPRIEGYGLGIKSVASTCAGSQVLALAREGMFLYYIFILLKMGEGIIRLNVYFFGNTSLIFNFDASLVMGVIIIQYTII